MQTKVKIYILKANALVLICCNHFFNQNYFLLRIMIIGIYFNDIFLNHLQINKLKNRF
jgi:hypothetical protein